MFVNEYREKTDGEMMGLSSGLQVLSTADLYPQPKRDIYYKELAHLRLRIPKICNCQAGDQGKLKEYWFHSLQAQDPKGLIFYSKDTLKISQSARGVPCTQPLFLSEFSVDWMRITHISKSSLLSVLI